MAKILIADDNEDILDILSLYLKKEGYDVIKTRNGAEAIDKFNIYKNEIDMVMLDVMMPIKNGYDVCVKIRENSKIPIILITAKGEESEKIMGLDNGADDYIVKPFSPSEVMARVRALFRRTSVDKKSDEKSDDIINIKNLSINKLEYIVSIDEKQVHLTKKEFETLWLLASYPNKVFTRENLLDSLWGYDYLGDTRSVDSHIKRLRSKLNEYQHDDWRIATIWGKGYKFEID